MLACNIVVPVLTLWDRRVRSSPMALFLITLAISVGMYLECYVIVTGFLRHNHLAFIVSSMELSLRASGACLPCART